MSELQAKPCDFQRHQEAATCDCLLCGWHVFDQVTERDGQGRVIIDGTQCLNGRPRADAFGGG